MLQQPSKTWIDMGHFHDAIEYCLEVGPYRECPHCHGEMVTMDAVEVSDGVIFGVIMDCPLCCDMPIPGRVLALSMN